MVIKNKNIDIDYSVIFTNKVPLLINDETWNKVFGNLNHKDLKELKEELKKLTIEKKKLNDELKNLIKEKRKAMTDIVNLSHRVNKGLDEYISELNEKKEKILKLNDQIDEITFRLETLPKIIKDTNFELLKVTIKYAYSVIKENEKKVTDISLEIESLRQKLRELIEEKNNHEEIKIKTYGFLHGILGHKEMEKLDNLLL